MNPPSAGALFSSFQTKGLTFCALSIQILPSGVKVVPPEKSGAFSEQSIMQFFMLDKTIMLCPSGEARIVCLSKPDKYLIATTAYPPHESDINKTFIAYPNANADYPYEGIYVPQDYVEGTYSAVYPETYNILRTVLCDLGILLAWFLLGGLIVSTITPQPVSSLSIHIGLSGRNGGFHLGALRRLSVGRSFNPLDHIINLCGSVAHGVYPCLALDSGDKNTEDFSCHTITDN